MNHERKKKICVRLKAFLQQNAQEMLGKQCRLVSDTGIAALKKYRNLHNSADAHYILLSQRSSINFTFDTFDKMTSPEALPASLYYV